MSEETLRQLDEEFREEEIDASDSESEAEEEIHDAEVENLGVPMAFQELVDFGPFQVPADLTFDPSRLNPVICSGIQESDKQLSI